MLLSEEDKRTVEQEIRKAEAATSGEIVFALTEQSGDYRYAVLQGALIGVAIATALYLALPLPHSIGLTIWTEMISFALCYALMLHFPMRRLLIPKREMEKCVRNGAFREFYASGLDKTREANGVLIYLSCLEHLVVVLGDRGIHEKLGDHQWSEARDLIIQGIHRGQAVKGICAAVESCARALAEHFPRRPDDTNELSDQVIDRTIH